MSGLQIKNFRKVFAGGGSEMFILVEGGGGNFVEADGGGGGVVEEVCTFFIFEPFIYAESKC